MIILIMSFQTSLLYSQVSGGWVEVLPMNEKRIGHAGVLIDSNQVLVCGGEGLDGILRSAEIYHINQDSWLLATPMIANRTKHKLIKFNDNEIIAISGINTLSCEIYNVAENSWNLTDSINFQRYADWTATLLKDGRILLTGGLNIFGENPETKYPRVCEVYNPKINSWELVDSLDIGRYGHSAVLLDSGEVLITGGFNENRINQALLFEPGTNTFTEIDTSAYYRHWHHSLLLNNGKALISGGDNLRVLNGWVYLVEEYDRKEGLFRPIFNIDNILDSHTIFELPENQLLVVGSLWQPELWQLIEYPSGTVLKEGTIDTVMHRVLIKIAEDRVISIGGLEIRSGSPPSGDFTNRVMIFDQKYTAIADNESPYKYEQKIDVYPNPFNHSCRMTYELIHRADVKMAIYDITGKQIQKYETIEGQPGSHSIKLDFSKYGSGIYFVYLLIDENPFIKKVISLK